MNENGQKKVSAPGPFAADVYNILQVLLSPLQVVGYVLYVIKFLQAGSESGGRPKRRCWGAGRSTT
jgi:hypothetical protein